MTDLVIDTSVLLKWFHSAGESEVEAARLILDAHVAGSTECAVLDLASYEIGNVLVRSLRWDATRVHTVLDTLHALVGPGLPLTEDARADAVDLAAQYGLTYYDAAWAALARGLGVPLVTADRQLLAASLGMSASHVAEALRNDS